MMTRERLPDDTMRRVACTPSVPGMRTSISTTSGELATTKFTACVAVRGLTDHLKVALGVEDHTKSHPQQLLIVDQENADHRTAATAAGRPRVACTRHPPPGQAPASRLPP